MIFDDLCPSKDVAQRRKQESLLNEITRWIGDETTPAKRSGVNVIQDRPESGVIFTGEYEAGGGSSAARLLLVKIEGINESMLGFFQQYPLIVGSFYHAFIEWYVSNYHEIAEFLKKKWYDHYSKIDFGVLRRLRETFYFHATSHMLLMTFCVENNAITEDKAIIYQQSFEKMMMDLIQDQEMRANPNKAEEGKAIDYLAIIRTMFKSGEFRLAANPSEFTVNHDGFVHDGCLCLYQNRFNQVTRMAIFDGASTDDIWDAVEEQGALIRKSSKERAFQINCKKKSPRFYKIPLSKLK